MKNIILLLLFSVLLSGCSNTLTGIKRTVRDNTFYSSSRPQIKIIIDDEIGFIGRKASNNDAQTSDFSDSFSADQKAFVFAEFDYNSNIKRGVLIRIDNIQTGSYIEDIYQNVKPKIYSKTIEINGKKYRSVITVANFDDKNFKENGVNNPGKVIFRAIGRIVDPNSQTILNIFYFEQISDENRIILDALASSLSDGVLTTENQHKAIRDFIGRAQKAFTISDLTAADVTFQQPTHTVQETSVEGISEKLIKLRQLTDRGIISELEYETRKKEILDNL